MQILLSHIYCIRLGIENKQQKKTNDFRRVSEYLSSIFIEVIKLLTALGCNSEDKMLVIYLWS